MGLELRFPVCAQAALAAHVLVDISFVSAIIDTRANVIGAVVRLGRFCFAAALQRACVGAPFYDVAELANGPKRRKRDMLGQSHPMKLASGAWPRQYLG